MLAIASWSRCSRPLAMASIAATAGMGIESVLCLCLASRRSLSFQGVGSGNAQNTLNMHKHYEVLQDAPFTVKEVGLGLLPVQEPLKPGLGLAVAPAETCPL